MSPITNIRSRLLVPLSIILLASCGGQKAAPVTSSVKTAKTVAAMPSTAAAVSDEQHGSTVVLPHRLPENTSRGGTGAAQLALDRLSVPSSSQATSQNLVGPTVGKGRARSEIQVHALSKDELPGVTGYYLRSSYVSLAPGGFAPLHSHARRPAFLQIIEGSVTQHRSDGLSFEMGPGDFTFSSNQLVHWWINENKTEVMKLWVVEVCTVEHKCTEPVDGGAVLLSDVSPKAAQAPANREVVQEIDLSVEFPESAELKGFALRLRRHEYAPGQKAQASEGRGPTFSRIDKGGVALEDGRTLPEGAITFGPAALHGTSSAPTVVYSVDVANLNDGKE